MNKRYKTLVQFLFIFAFVIVTGFHSNSDVYVTQAAMGSASLTEQGAVEIETEYIIKHSAEWGQKNEHISGDHGAYWTASKKLLVMGADAYAVDASVIENAANGEYPKDTPLSDIIPYLKGYKCSGTDSCKARCTQAVRDNGCRDQCAVSTIDMENACKGHGWVVLSVEDLKYESSDCERGVEYIFMQVKCKTSLKPCKATVWLCLFSPIQSDHAIDCEDIGGGQHKYFCPNCETVFKTENHNWESWITLSKDESVRYCNDCDAEERNINPKPEASGSSGHATYLPHYPYGTTTGCDSIADDIEFVPNTYTEDYEESTAPKDGWYNSYKVNTTKPNELVKVYLKKGETYYPSFKWKEIDNSDQNKYTTRAESELFSGTSESSDKFWAKYKLTYKAGDTSGSTKAVNVPSLEEFYCSNDGITEGFSTEVSFDSTAELTFDVSWKETEVTANSASTLYRKGYIFDNWKNSAWGGAVWKAGESRKTLPNGAPMKSSVLTAKWKKEVYTIKYDKNVPSNATHDASTPADTTATFDSKLSALASTSLKGWTFLGWYTNESGTDDGNIRLSDYVGKSFTFDPKPTAGENSTIKVYAHWKANTYTVNLFRNRPSISIQSLIPIYGASFSSGGTSWTWNAEGGYYTTTFTYDSTSYLPLPSDIFTMTGWTPTNQWYWYNNDTSEPYVTNLVSGYDSSYTYWSNTGFNDTGMGYAKWNFTSADGETVAIYEGWMDKAPDTTTGEQDLVLTAKGSISGKTYDVAGITSLNHASPYATYSVTDFTGYTYAWNSIWLNEDINLTLSGQDTGSGIAALQTLINRYPSEASLVMKNWKAVRNEQLETACSMTKTNTYNGKTIVQGWANDYSDKDNKAQTGSESLTQEFEIHIDKNAPKKVSTTRTTGTFERPLSGDGNPYLGNPGYDNYKYTGAVVDDSEMCTRFTATVDDRDSNLYAPTDVAGIKHVWVEVWDTEDSSIQKSYPPTLFMCDPKALDFFPEREIQPLALVLVLT